MPRPPTRQLDLLSGLQGFEKLGEIDRFIHERGVRSFLGIDEAGRGPLAGPVVAAAVRLPDDCLLPGLDDSKRLSPRRREELYAQIKSEAIGWGVAFGWPEEIDATDILQTTKLAMIKAVNLAELRGGRCELLVVDGNQKLPVERAQRTVVGGDRLCSAVAAASIMAKVVRDRWMRVIAKLWPGYGFERHKGYGTARHLEAIAALGPCPIHRRSFRGVREHLRAEECAPG